jgi:hypothetical protein
MHGRTADANGDTARLGNVNVALLARVFEPQIILGRKLGIDGHPDGLVTVTWEPDRIFNPLFTPGQHLDVSAELIWGHYL